jgi:hypothetical protein
MIHLTSLGRLLPVCEDPSALLFTDDKRKATCTRCLELAPKHLADAASKAYARYKPVNLRPRPTGVLDIGR